MKATSKGAKLETPDQMNIVLEAETWSKCSSQVRYTMKFVSKPDAANLSMVSLPAPPPNKPVTFNLGHNIGNIKLCIILKNLC
jgi:hypothetical protein